MNFLILGIFSDFSELILRLLNKQKGGLIARGHVDATWHSGPRGSATRTQVAPTRRDVTYLYLS